MSKLSPEGRAFLEATRSLDEPTSLDRQRIHAKTIAAIAAAGATGAIATKAAALACKAIAPVGWLGGAVAGALLAVAVIGVGTAVELVTGSMREGTATSAGSPLERPAANTGSSASAAPAPRGATVALTPRGEPSAGAGSVEKRTASDSDSLPQPSLVPRLAASAPALDAPATRDAPEVPVSPAGPSARAIDTELAVLREAQEALRAGKPAEAVRALDAYGANHAGGALEEERLAARIIAACSGHDPAARAEAERFVRERPDSPLRERVGAACPGKAPP